MRWIQAIAAMTLLACSGPVAAQEERVTVFEGATIVDLADGALLPGHALVVADGMIRWMGPTEELDVEAGARRIDASGRYVMAGLADMHVHMGAEDVPLFLANGITTVREMNGAAHHLALRDSIAVGSRVGPRMYVASALQAGEEQPWRHELVESADAAYAAAHRIADAGYDYIKVYDGLSADAYAAFVEASRTLDVPLTGHVPRTVGLDDVLEAGQFSIEHVEQIMYATVGTRPDTSVISGIVERIAASEIAVTPTLAAMRMLGMQRTSAYAERLRRPEVRYVDEGLLGWWRTLAPAEGAEHAGPGDARRHSREAFHAFLSRLTAALHEAGVPLLVGTDTPNPLLVPGYSIHLELAALVEAGIPVADVLREATAGAAAFAGEADNWGTLREGMAADVLLLGANPLEDLSTLERPLGVMAAGHWMDRAELDRMLEARLPDGE